jgi:hypothetical protein
MFCHVLSVVLKLPPTDPGFVLGGLDSSGFDRNLWFKYSKIYE